VRPNRSACRFSVPARWRRRPRRQLSLERKPPTSSAARFLAAAVRVTTIRRPASRFRQGYGYAVGYLRLRVSPRHAQVFVDGYYAGVVDDYDGIVQSMTLEDGPYHIEIVAPGFAPLEFDVRILPGQKITYRGDLLPQRP
jgi:hypothetical protein